MRKRRRKAAKTEDRNKSDSELQCRKEAASSIDMDRISMLPDELLGFILSHLALKEASATSILSRRWKCLWTFTPSLDFNGVDSLLKFHHLTMACLNRAIAYYSNALDEERYALAREVQTLKLNLTHKANCGQRRDVKYYVFPYRFLHANSNNAIHFKQLKTISLHFVNVNGEALEFFLHNCPLLEDLSVSQSGELSPALRVIGPFPSLKRLKIRWCHNLELVEIRDVNLVYFEYGGKRIPFLLHNVPMLVHISVERSLSMEDALLQFFGILPQLEIFNVCIQLRLDFHDTVTIYEVVKLSNLKQLMVTYSGGCVESLLSLTNLIRAAPCLQKFVFKSRLYGEFCEREIQKKSENLYTQLNLKEVEFVGYHGTTSELELVMYFLENDLALEKILINPRRYFESPRVRVKKQLAKKVPPEINMEIL